MHITLNGISVELLSKSLTDCLIQQNIDITKKGIAIAINHTVIPRAIWTDQILNDGDSIEVVRPFQGG